MIACDARWLAKYQAPTLDAIEECRYAVATRSGAQAAGPPRYRSMQARKRLTVASLLVGAALLSGCRLPWGSAGPIQAITLSGTVDAHEVDLSFQAPGSIRVLGADEGRTVNAG